MEVRNYVISAKVCRIHSAFLCSFSSGPGSSKLYHCKLSSDQRSLFFDPFESGSETGSVKSGSDESRSGIQPVDISKVQLIEMCCADEDKKG